MIYEPMKVREQVSKHDLYRLKCPHCPADCTDCPKCNHPINVVVSVISSRIAPISPNVPPVASIASIVLIAPIPPKRNHPSPTPPDVIFGRLCKFYQDARYGMIIPKKKNPYLLIVRRIIVRLYQRLQVFFVKNFNGLIT